MDPAQLESLMIFPLPEVVLFPGTMLPLHIFEPRYRAMVRDALERERPIAMATLDATRPEDSYGRPAVRPVMGVGRLAEWDELADGRYLIVLEGIGRVRIANEYAPERPYRLVRALEMPDEPGDVHATQAAVEAVRALSFSMQAHNPRLALFLREELEAHPDPAVFSNRLAAMISGDVDAQYRMLDTVRVSQRMEAIVDRVSDLLARMTVQPGGDPN